MRFAWPGVAALGLLCACGAASAPATVIVTMNEWAMHSNQASIPGGGVTVVMRNEGRAPHQLAILKADASEVALRAGDVAVAAELGRVGGSETIASGSHREATFDLRPGSYQFICMEPGHYQAGMHAAVDVRWP